jgi:hypothetical protein
LNAIPGQKFSPLIFTQIRRINMTTDDKIQRSVLPIPDVKHVGLTTYDAKDPET